jgi:heat shock protein HtpX
VVDVTIRNTIVTTLLLTTLGGLFVLVGYALGGGTSGAAAGLVLGLMLAGATYWFSDRLAIRAAHAVEVGEAEQPRLHHIVRELTTAACMPMPRLFLSPSPQPNAFATGRSPRHAAVAVTAGLLPLLDDGELRGVLAHELSHVANRDILVGSIAAALGMALTFLARITLWSNAFGGRRRADPVSVVLLLLGIVMAPLAAGVLRMALSRSREYQADRSGAALVGDGEPLARALAKLGQMSGRIPMNVDAAHATAYIVDPLTWVKGRVPLSNLLADHPPIGERIERLHNFRSLDRPHH